MGNSSGKDKKKADQAVPEGQQADQQVKVEVPPVKVDPKKAKKEAEEKAKQEAEALKQAAAKAEAERKLKEEAEKKAKEEAEKKAKEEAKKAEEAAKAAAEKKKLDINIQKIEKEVKKVEGEVKETAEKVKEAFDASKAKAVAQDFGKNFHSFALDTSKYFIEVEKITCRYYGMARDEVNLINREVPLAISNFRRDYVFPIDHRIRAAAHYGITGLTFLACLQARRGFFSTLKTTGIVGLTTGFFIHPEPINPFRRQNFPEEIHDTEEI